jgi:hypothetical protein
MGAEINTELNTDLGRRWLAATLSVLSAEASEHDGLYFVRVHDGRVSIGKLVEGVLSEADGYITVQPNLSTTELLVLAAKIGSLLVAPKPAMMVYHQVGRVAKQVDGS